MRRGFFRRSVAASSPSSAAVPGRRFWITTSARSRISRSSRPRSPASRKSTTAEIAEYLARERRRHVVAELHHHDIAKRRLGTHLASSLKSPPTLDRTAEEG